MSLQIWGSSLARRQSCRCQTEAAQRLGVGQSRVSDLMRGKWEKFSLEMLITLEARLGRQVILEFAGAVV